MRSRRGQRVRFICIKGCVRKVQMDFPLNPLSPIRGGKYDKAEDFGTREKLPGFAREE